MPKTETGQLSVYLDSGSGFLNGNVPVEVRDSKLRLVSRGRANQTLSLPQGLYQVSAILEGQKHSAVVQVGKVPTSVNLPEADDEVAPEAPESLAYQRPRYTQSMSQEVEPALESLGADAKLVLTRGAVAQQLGATSWAFTSEGAMEFVPFAVFQIGDRRQRVSLPISAASGVGANNCMVRVEQTASGAHAHAWISPQRVVANALQNMLAGGYLIDAIDVADEAVQLMRDKYEDPTGAALGGLILHKAGRLDLKSDWVRNLATDFPWLPDGKILLARIYASREEREAEALDLALSVAQQVPLFAESHALLLDLMRRWPSEAGLKERQEAVARVARVAPYIDPEPICLSFTLKG